MPNFKLQIDNCPFLPAAGMDFGFKKEVKR